MRKMATAQRRELGYLFAEDAPEIVSPDYATNTIEEGLDEFCQAAGISRELTDQEELKRQLSGVRQVWELEEIIVSMKVTAAAYQNSGYEEEYETYESTHYASDTSG